MNTQSKLTELTREQKLEIEEKAIMALIEMGVKFSVPLKIHPVNPPKWIRLWNKLFPKNMKVWRDSKVPKNWDVETVEVPDVNNGAMKKIYVRNFHIKPLYLGTIDAIRRLYIEIEYNEEAIQNEPIQESEKLFRYISVMAEIAAIAVLNESSISDPLSRSVKELKDFFIDNLTVDRLQKMTSVISQMMNPGGFTSSIRSIKEMGITQPKPNKANLIE